MTVENLHDAIGQLPSDLIAKVDEKRSRGPKGIPFRQYAAIAACLVVVLGCSLFLTRLISPKGGSAESAMLQAADEANRFDAPAEAAPKYEETATEAPAAMSDVTNAEPEAPAEDEAVCGYATIETYAAGEIPPEGVTEEGWEGYPPFPAEDVQYADTQNIGTACGTSDPVLCVLRSPAELEALHQDFGYCDLEAFDDCCEIYDESWFETHDLLVALVKGLPAEGTFSLASITESDGSWCVCFYSGGPYTEERIDRFVFAALEKDQIPEGSRLFAMFEVP